MTYMTRKYKGFSAIIFALFFAAAFSHAQEGVRLYEHGMAAESISFLEADIESGNALPVEYNYLGLAYYQTGNFAKSVEAFKKGLAVSGTNKKRLYFNMGNSYFSMGDFENAVNSYSMASVADPNYGEPVLNKANAEMKLDRLKDAQDDYARYLVLCPDAPQKPAIEKIIALIDEEIAFRAESERLAQEEAERIRKEEERIAAEKAEQERIAAEKKAEEERLAAEKRAEEERIAAERRAEQERIAAEKRAEEERIAAAKRAEQERLAAEARAAEEERRRKLLEEVAESLRRNSETTNISADAESAIEYEYESDIE
ncbi:MAG: tetratricopeptide repeat protein [Treponemataceae bacterium]|nr:tetratricopeptide repeat protein [Treponemataceae bacterium]